MNLPKVFIFSYARSEFCFTLNAPGIQGLEKFLVLHNEEEAKLYANVAKKANATIIVSGAPTGWPGNGKVRQQRVIYENLADGEWALFLDDDIITFRSVVPEHYWGKTTLPKIKRRKGYGELWAHTPDSEDGKKMIQEMIALCEQENIGYCGINSMAAVSTLETSEDWINGINPYLIKGWESAKWHWGRHPIAFQLIKKDQRIALDDSLELDDVDLWAKCMLVYGKVLTNQWLLLDAPLYGEMPGGLQAGGKTERTEQRNDACESLIKKYPGLFKPARWLDAEYLASLDFSISNETQREWRSRYIKETGFDPSKDRFE
jgi:hypothetical protein